MTLLAFSMRRGSGFTRTLAGSRLYRRGRNQINPSTVTSADTSAPVSNTDLVNQTESRFHNARFWLKTYDLNLSSSSKQTTLPSRVLVQEVVEQVKETINGKKIEISMSENGLVIIPSYQLLIPLHRNIVQTQHAVIDPSLTSSENTSEAISVIAGSGETVKMMVCGFAPRSSNAMTTEEERQRPIDPDRVKALTIALGKLSIDVTAEDLMGDKYAGTPPARMFRSFIAPRANADYSSFTSLDKNAERIALQIEHGLRQIRADEASSYLINTDKSIGIFNSTSNNTTELPKPKHPIALVLDNIRSAENVGAMFRTAETAAIQEVVTCGISAHPPNPKLRKTAFSAVDIVSSRHFIDVMEAIRRLKEEGYTILVMETTTKSINYAELNAKKYDKIAVIVGNETTGVHPMIMEMADLLVAIPTYGIKNSLNVSVAASVMIFELLRQYNAQ